MPGCADAFAAGRELLALEAALAGLADPADAPALAARLRNYAARQVAAGLGGLPACQLISALNDRLTVRLIELTAARHRLPPVDWCWLALGSEGRQEQSFLTDQDNGLIFNAADDHEAVALRRLFLPFAQAVNEQLAACGFTLCSGGIMAGRAECCLSFDEWRERFIDWVRRPEPTALLNASIFFDLRPLYGDAALGERLRTLLLGLTTDTPAFLHLMAANALHADVPLGWLGEVQAVHGAAGDEIDLKKFGSRIFVDAARIFALASGERAVSSSARLRASGLPDDEIQAVDAAFSHVLRLRLDQQMADLAVGQPVGYGLKPARLHDVDRAILREALKQARRLQQRLKLNYAL